jgi:hypothetical protein
VQLRFGALMIELATVTSEVAQNDERAGSISILELLK